MPIMRWVAAGKAVLENTVCPQLSFTTLPMPISAIQDIINQGTCHAILVSGELQFGGLHGIVLQVIPAQAISKLDFLSRIMHVAGSLLLQLLNGGRRCCKRTAHPGFDPMSCRSARRTMPHLSGLSNILMETDQQWEWPGQPSYQIQMCHLRPHSHSSRPEASIFMYELILP